MRHKMWLVVLFCLLSALPPIAGQGTPRATSPGSSTASSLPSSPPSAPATLTTASASTLVLTAAAPSTTTAAPTVELLASASPAATAGKGSASTAQPAPAVTQPVRPTTNGSLPNSGGGVSVVHLIKTVLQLASLVPAFGGTDMNAQGGQTVGGGFGGMDLNSSCAADLQAVSDGLGQGQRWALEMLDAMGKLQAGVLTGHTTLMGDYDLCLGVQHRNNSHTIRGQYCTMNIKLPALMKGQSFFTVAGASAMSLHVCMPKSCSPSEILAVFDSYLVPLASGASNVACSQERRPLEDTAFIAAVAIFSVLGLLCLLGTACDWRLARMAKHHQQQQRPDSNSHDHVHPSLDHKRDLNGNSQPPLPSDSFCPPGPVATAQQALVPPTSGSGKGGGVGAPVSPSEQQHNGDASHVSIALTQNCVARRTEADVKTKPAAAMEKGLATQLLLSFSLLANGRKVLDCGPTSPADIACLHGIRVLSITWVVMGHCFATSGVTLGNQLGTAKLLNIFPYTVLPAGLFSVDSFFLLAGCLTSYLFLRNAQKSGLHVSTMVLYYVHRIWRLTPLYALILAFWMGIFPYLKDGPFADQVSTDADGLCRKYWYHNLFYVNNLFASVDKLCLGWSWYLSNDMQFYVIAPIVLVLWVLRGRFPKFIGFFLCTCMILIHVITTGVISYKKKISFFVNIMVYMDNIYIVPWCRVGPYAIGLILGFILNKTRCKYSMDKVTIVLGWTLAWALGLTLSYVKYDKYGTMLDEGPAWTGWSVTGSAIYEALSRVLWAVSVAWVVLACATGYGGAINSLLSWRAWLPLSRLSYGVYFTHLIILNVFQANRKKLFYLDGWTGTEMTCGVTVLSFLTAFIFSMLIEAPCVALEKAILGKIFKRH